MKPFNSDKSSRNFCTYRLPPKNEAASSGEPQDRTCLEKLRYDRRSAAEALSISIRTLDYRISSGQIRIRRDGNKVLIPHSELVRYARTDHPSRARGTSVSSTPRA